MQKSWLQLLYKWWRNGQCHEHREKSRLHVNVTIVKVPECEGVKETREYVKHELPLNDYQRINAKIEDKT